MHTPSATYRVQFNSRFTFEAARQVIAYLRELGVSTVYASPVFKARDDSTHGYDVVDPNRLNPQVGDLEEFDRLIDEVRWCGMGWVQDFVPNHMAYDSRNSMLMDVFEKGAGSAYFDFFDVVWDHLRENLRGKLIAPFLGGPYGETIEKGEISLHYGEGGFFMKYYGTEYPIRIESYADILGHRLDALKERLGEDDPDFIKTLGILHVFKSIPPEPESAETRNAQIQLARGVLRETFENNDVAREFIEENVADFNRQVDLLDGLLSRQWFRLTYWRVATKEINYQRFFNVNELISLRMEEESVFDHVHRFVLGLLKEGKIDGLRIDHVDGLYDPTRYLHNLRERAGGAFIVVEKILEMSEQLPGDWPVEGTTGYDFMNYVNGLFVEAENGEALQKIYEEFAGESFDDYEELLYEKKKLLIERHLTGDLDNLTYVLKKISITTRHGIDLTWIGLKTALAEMSAVFPVYRTYADSETISEQDRGFIQRAIERAGRKHPELRRELAFIESVLWLDYPAHLTDDDKRLWLSFVMRFQQFTSPLMAKGLEDTTFYVYNRLISLNEVGGNPGRFGVSPEEFHTFNAVRAARHPRTLNATATHDAKRGEDARARINALSEMPARWRQHLELWHEQNRAHKKIIAGEEVPDKNREYFLYQTLVGALPFDEAGRAGLTARVKGYMIKAAREAKVHTFWLDPNPAYEEALLEFTEAILKSDSFLESFTAFQRSVAEVGVFNSLSQTLLKITAPGVPDFYQGGELWDFNLVDPDNRRPVDYERRKALLRQMKEDERESLASLIESMLANRADGRVKLFTIYRALNARGENKELFDAGDYLPLPVSGERGHRAVAFARRRGRRWAVVAAPRLVAPIVSGGEPPLGESAWRESRVELPRDLRVVWRNVFTDQIIDGKGALRLAEVFRQFPVGFLIGEEID